MNSPGNPTGELHDLRRGRSVGRARGVPVLSDECYAEFTWTGPADDDPAQRAPQGVLAVHSLSKRDNFAGARIGFYAGDAELVHYLREVRKHAGLMPPGPVQAAAVVALGDDAHVEAQRERYLRRLVRLREILADCRLPAATCRPARSTCGCRPTATPGRRRATSPSGRASSCRRASSTVRRSGRLLPRRGRAARRPDRAGRSTPRRLSQHRVVGHTPGHITAIRSRGWPTCSTTTRAARHGTR